MIAFALKAKKKPPEAPVAFLSPRALLDLTSESVMQWRPRGASDAAVDVVAETEAALAAEGAVAGSAAEAVDATVANVLGANQAAYDALPRDQQCFVADKVVQAKAALTSALEARAAANGGAALTAEDVHAAVASLREGTA